ncbi:MAG TPA: DEAD/DEAH box helicase [Thermoanaerobaculia bacterium]|nr:DEAD/DEAH box helicase [Thermoanaerobaculia bacterium]
MADTTFASLGLRDSLLQTLTALGYEAPTPVQGKTIPALLAGRDVIGQAQTGTGKTAAFALPILQKINPESRDTQALVLAPTRELAMQVAEAFHTYAAGMKGLAVLPVYGGAPIVHQLKRLERGVQIVVGTPGRLIDVLDRKSLRLDAIQMVVLDEADEMLKMGFIDDVEKILSAMPSTRQIALFSATMPPEVLRIAKKHMPNAERIEIEHKTMTAPMIEQRFLNVSEAQKLEALTQILELEEYDAVLIFRRTKNGAAELAERLEGRGFAAEAMHGDMKQNEREAVIRRLRAGQVEIVVATDVAARGLDVEQISHVINYDIPYDVEAYVHRIGRTGRAGRTGLATLFITPRERRMMREIERYTKTSIKPMKMPTQADVAARRVTQLKETIRKTIAEGDLDLHLQLVEQLAEEGPHDMAEIAAALASLASSTRPLAAPKEPEVAAAAPYRPPVSRQESIEGGTRLRMDVGKRDGVRPADVVGSIANEAGIAGRDIGPIDIRDDVTFVTVPSESADLVIEKVSKARFRGRSVNLRKAGPGDDAMPARRERPATRPSYGRDEKPRPRPPARRDEGPVRATRPFARDDRPPRAAKPYARDDRPPRAEKPYAKPYARDDRPPRAAKPYAKPYSRDDKPPRKDGGGAFAKFKKPGGKKRF